MLFKVYITALKRFRIFLNLFDFQRVGTPIINRWTGVAVLCCHEKSSSYIPNQKLLALAVLGKYHSKLSMRFNLAFLMECKYHYLLAIHSKKVKQEDISWDTPIQFSVMGFRLLHIKVFIKTYPNNHMHNILKVVGIETVIW